ncbi:ABC transporter substrate-binding protein [Hansschlegelia plantiphila]|uniref:ABC transporter substrate-binding protein n=1 Tax=Hansschlegelia plantiphila TaxID=374655 RepID=UPI0022F270B0|nr:ABC transporter substrate-binding protein [Hansschlegelia plantiphila]
MKLSALCVAVVAAWLALPAAAQEPPAPGPQVPGPAAKNAPAPMDFPFAVLRQFPENPPWWNNIVTVPPDDDGIAGANLGIVDNSTTGSFLKQNFRMAAQELVPFGEDPMPAFNRILESGAKFILLAVPADALLKMADAAKDKDVILFNAAATDDRLRGADCRADVLHTAPSRAMLTDALAQYLVTKRWAKWLLLTGREADDRLYAEAVKRSAKKFGAKIVDERTWNFGPDARESGNDDISIFTQGVSYDVIVIADERGEFGPLIGYRSWDPRPTAGTAGLTPTTWSVTVTGWGAEQIQNRFFRQSKRGMRPLDFQMWLAMRTIGESAARIRSNDPKKLREFIFGPKFELAGFKGGSFSYRPWDNQLRQPIVLTSAEALVAASPQEGFLHQTNPLDTIGFDKPESQCHFPTP